MIDHKSVMFERCVKLADEVAQCFNNMGIDDLIDELMDSLDIEVRSGLDGTVRSVWACISSNVELDTKYQTITGSYSDFIEVRYLDESVCETINQIIQEWLNG